jgi:hypothetical protein
MNPVKAKWQATNVIKRSLGTASAVATVLLPQSFAPPGGF